MSFLTHFLLLQVFVSFFILSITPPVSASSDVDTPIDESRCFKGYANAGTTVLMDALPGCLDIMRSSSGSSGKRWADHFNELQSFAASNPNSNIILTISQKAAEVYYSDSFCGKLNPKISKILCYRLGKLAQLHPSGLYAASCSKLDPKPCSCAPLRAAIIDTLGYCDTDNRYKNLCNELVAGFLSSPKCSSGSKAECLSFVANQKVSDSCGINDTPSNWGANDLALCTGATGAPNCSVTTAEVSDPSIDPTGATGGGGNGSETTSTDEQLASAADRAFGNTGLGNFDRASTSGSLKVPSVKAESLRGGSPSNNSSAPLQGGGVQTAALSNLPATTRFAPPTRGEPGGKKAQQTPTANNANGGGSALGGSPVPSSNTGSSARRARRRRRRGGGSRLKETADGLARNSFMGADGGGNSAGNTIGNKLDPQIKAQIEKNQARALADKGALNKAFQKNLRRIGGNEQDLFLKASYFPSHTGVYLWLNQNGDLLNESGQ